MMQAGGVGFPLSSVALTHVTSTGPLTTALAEWLPLESELADIVFESACALWLHANNPAELIATIETTFLKFLMMSPPIFKISTTLKKLAASRCRECTRHKSGPSVGPKLGTALVDKAREGPIDFVRESRSATFLMLKRHSLQTIAPGSASRRGLRCRGSDSLCREPDISQRH